MPTKGCGQSSTTSTWPPVIVNLVVVCIPPDITIKISLVPTRMRFYQLSTSTQTNFPFIQCHFISSWSSHEIASKSGIPASTDLVFALFTISSEQRPISDATSLHLFKALSNSSASLIHLLIKFKASSFHMKVSFCCVHLTST